MLHSRRLLIRAPTSIYDTFVTHCNTYKNTKPCCQLNDGWPGKLRIAPRVIRFRRPGLQNPCRLCQVILQSCILTWLGSRGYAQRRGRGAAPFTDNKMSGRGGKPAETSIRAARNSGVNFKSSVRGKCYGGETMRLDGRWGPHRAGRGVMAFHSDE